MTTFTDLPEELILGEIGATLDIETALSLCLINKDSRRLCNDLDAWKRWFDRLDYRKTQKSILYWSYSGLLRGVFYRLLPSLLPSLDLRTVVYVYLYALEQEEVAEAKEVRKLALDMFGVDIWLKYFTAISGSYKNVRTLIEAIKNLAKPDRLMVVFNLAYDSFSSVNEPHNNKIITFYLTDLIVAAISDSELLALYSTHGNRLLMTNFSISLLPAIFRAERSKALANDPYVGPLLLNSNLLTKQNRQVLAAQRPGSKAVYLPPYTYSGLLERLNGVSAYEELNVDATIRLIDPEEAAYAIKGRDDKYRANDQRMLIGNGNGLGYTRWVEEFERFLAL